jgi:G3E family GTPase
MDIVLEPATDDTDQALREAIERAISREFTSLDCPGTHRLEVPETGYFALFTEHHPDEFNATLDAGLKPIVEAEFKPDHEHDEEVSSVGISTTGDLDYNKFQRWLSNMLQTQGTDIFRMKGILSFRGQENRFVFQGVHMLFDGRPDKPWGNQARHNQLIFIGRNLDREQINQGFLQCLA